MNKQLTVSLSALLLLSGCFGGSNSSNNTTEQADILVGAPLPITPPVTSSENDRFIDTDQDGIADTLDSCPETISNTQVDSNGCLVSLRIEAEDYVNAYDLTEGNSGAEYKSGNVDIFHAGDTDGGHAVRDNQVSEWQSYNISLPEGYYQLSSRVASVNGEGEYSLYLDEKLIVADSLTHSTGNETSWSTRQLAKYYIPAGDHTLKVVIDEEGTDFNWFDLVAVGPTLPCNQGKPSADKFECEMVDLPADQVITNQDRIFYQMNYSTLGRDNAFQKVTAQLDRIESLQVNTLWLMPIHPRSATSTTSFNLNYLLPEKENSLSPYSISDYLTIEESLGDLNDLRMLINEAHKRGISVILDWVANHTAWNHPWLLNKDWYTQVDNVVVQPQEFPWYDVADLNFDNSQMRAAMIDSMLYWIKQGVDGFRCDYTTGVPFDFWQTAIEQIRAVNPKAIMLAEGTIGDLDAGFDFTFSWDENYNVSHAFETGDATLVTEQPQLAADKHFLRYSTNHDLTANATEKNPIEIACSQIELALGECSAYPELLQQGALAQFALHLFYGDVPLIYSGQEVGEEKKTSFYLDDLIEWSKNADTLAQYKALMAYYADADTVKNGTELRYNDASVVSIEKTTDNERFVMLNNVLATDNSYQVPDVLKGDYVDILSGDVVTLADNYTLAGFEYVLLTQDYTPPEPDSGAIYEDQLWIKGNFNSWDAGNDIDSMTYIGNNLYIGTVNIQTTENSYFKITNSDLTWESGAATVATLGEPMTFSIIDNGAVDAAQLQVTETGLYSFIFDASNRDAPILTISKDIETYPGDPVYVRGYEGYWDADANSQMTYIGDGYYIWDVLADDNGDGTYNKWFKFGNASWVNGVNAGTFDATLDGGFVPTIHDSDGSTVVITQEKSIRIIYHAINVTTHEGEMAVISNN